LSIVSIAEQVIATVIGTGLAAGVGMVIMYVWQRRTERSFMRIVYLSVGIALMLLGNPIALLGYLFGYEIMFHTGMIGFLLGGRVNAMGSEKKPIAPVGSGG
jgi:hypothetical protein